MLGLLGTPVFAADMPIKAPPTAAKAPYSWTGLYVGIAGGWAKMNTTTSSGVLFPTTLPAYSASGGILGGTIGYNWQIGASVLGVEGDLSWADLSADSVGFLRRPGL